MTDLVVHLNENTLRIVDLVGRHDLGLPVPSCGEWTLADLAWHLAEVQVFWAWVVEQGALLPDQYQEPSRPPEAELPAFLDSARAHLVDVLRSADPAAPAWSWSDDHTVGFTVRRQAHEALIHRVDAEQTVDRPTPIDPELAADGVDEILTVFVAGTPPWASFTPDDATVSLSTRDRGGAWCGRFGHVHGTSPESGRQVDGDGFELLPGGPARTHLSGSAADLDLWLWGRVANDRLVLSGEAEDAARLRRLVNAVTH